MNDTFANELAKRRAAARARAARAATTKSDSAQTALSSRYVSRPNSLRFGKIDHHPIDHAVGGLLASAERT
jgi:hypothetical protein